MFKNKNGEKKMRVRKFAYGNYEVLINEIPKYEIYNASVDMGYPYWQISTMDLINDKYCPSGVINACDTLRESKEWIFEKENQ
jgi:hypothetical protein|tara:strand:+ start:485 stop:733 length:249 start_codon:yes stop_codon:yes gene_type:complete